MVQTAIHLTSLGWLAVIVVILLAIWCAIDNYTHHGDIWW